MVLEYKGTSGMEERVETISIGFCDISSVQFGHRLAQARLYENQISLIH